jgi:hypothetical protein
MRELVSVNTGSFAQTLQSVYSRVGNRAGKLLVGDKSVSDISYFPVLNRVGLFDGEIKVIHIVRDVRDILVSLERLDWIKNRRIFPRSWSHANLGLNDLLIDRPFYHFLRYEDFVASPELTLNAIFDFLRVDREDVLSISPAKRGVRYTGLAHHEKLQWAITPSEVGVWKNGLNGNLAILAEGQSLEALARFGYEHL